MASSTGRRPPTVTRHVLLLGEIAARLALVEVRCSRCDRHRRLSTARLVAQYGADAPCPDVLRALTADCPKREAFSLHERCDPYMPGLADVM
jgi:hypothetical protein